MYLNILNGMHCLIICDIKFQLTNVYIGAYIYLFVQYTFKETEMKNCFSTSFVSKHA